MKIKDGNVNNLMIKILFIQSKVFVSNYTLLSECIRKYENKRERCLFQIILDALENMKIKGKMV